MRLLFYEDVLILVAISKMSTDWAEAGHVVSSHSMERAISRRTRLCWGVWNVGALLVFDDEELWLLFTLVFWLVFKRICFCIVKCLASIIAVCSWWFSSRRSEVAALSLECNGASMVDLCRRKRSAATAGLSLALCLLLEGLYQLHFSPAWTFALGNSNLLRLQRWLRRFACLLGGRVRTRLLALLALEVTTSSLSRTRKPLDRGLLAPLSTRTNRFGRECWLLLRSGLLLRRRGVRRHLWLIFIKRPEFLSGLDCLFIMGFGCHSSQTRENIILSGMNCLLSIHGCCIGSRPLAITHHVRNGDIYIHLELVASSVSAMSLAEAIQIKLLSSPTSQQLRLVLPLCLWSWAT